MFHNDNSFFVLMQLLPFSLFHAAWRCGAIANGMAMMSLRGNLKTIADKNCNQMSGTESKRGIF